MNHTTSNNHLKQPEDTQKKHNTADTSREAYEAITASGQQQKVKESILQAIKEHQPVTSRRLSELAQIERGTITGALNKMEGDASPQIKVAKKAKCPITGKRVKWYSLPEWPQTSLFHD